MVDKHYDQNHEIDKTPREARQGERGPSMLLVLGLGILGLVLAYFAIGWMNSDEDSVSLSVIEQQEGAQAPAPSREPGATQPGGAETPQSLPDENSTPIIRGLNADGDKQ